jgi:uncharacterized membrane protein YczE
VRVVLAAHGEADIGSGTVVRVFTAGTVVQVFLLAAAVPTDTWTDRGPAPQA